MGYLRNNATMPDAMAAARRDGISFDTSVWITSLGKVLMLGQRPGDLMPRKKEPTT